MDCRTGGFQFQLSRDESYSFPYTPDMGGRIFFAFTFTDTPVRP